MGAGESRVGWFGVVAGVRVGRPSCGSRMMPLAGLRISCGLREKRVHLAHSGRLPLRGVRVAALSCGSRMMPSAGSQICARISCGLAKMRAHLVLSGMSSLRGVRVTALSRGSCISPAAGQWDCGRISSNMTRIDCYNALPGLLWLQKPRIAGLFWTFSRLTRKVTPVGFEPTTLKLEVSCSIQLSYGAVRQRVPL